MKLLQICNVANICGGTFGCVYSIANCLPDWEHEAIATNSGRGVVEGETAKRFPGKVSRLPPPLAVQSIESAKPDAIIFHNTSEHCIPQRLPPGVPRFFYQHSAAKACTGARRRCDVFWAVSNFLADRVGIERSMVLYQPVPCPPKPEGESRRGGDSLTVGMICTANRDKWKEAVSIHDFLHREHPEINWEFVGCPDALVVEMKKACGGKATFHETSYTARSLMWNWDAMLYHCTSVVETYGRTVCEAQRTGCIPIVTKRGGFVEQILHGNNGFLCYEHEAFSAALRMIKPKDARQFISASCKKHGNDRGSLKNWRRTFLNWFQAQLDSK